jgi:cyclic dehypoxanthinyl futalosine synthase
MNYMNDLNGLYQKALNLEFLTAEEGLFLFKEAPLTSLMHVADELRKKQVPHGKVSWQIDRNVNTTNVCIANCKFCNFYRIPGHAEAYITTMDTYREKIRETLKWGGDQLLLQGGHHPDLGLKYYTDTFSAIKAEFPEIRLHTLGPPEVAHIAKLEKMTHHEVLSALKAAGMDSLPGAGAEILVDRANLGVAKGPAARRPHPHQGQVQRRRRDDEDEGSFRRRRPSVRRPHGRRVRASRSAGHCTLHQEP